ncbi:Oidioi.mRNA.OKI2018_I69.PAR.g9579.t1.cds [Oikopleura dioica]|uniref:Oidioi.mRNA.OKI2018_I69.PAR.g9579.t1.cds n=1 Tax=Oikopleura dioica TaxID=34765 RepID=A0ABN7RPV1_OIKDI|nr:Oidioi.mRNA.OKI2018_I69.PAR.g9579.t1.cds [Oikopleura dioica]
MKVTSCAILFVLGSKAMSFYELNSIYEDCIDGMYAKYLSENGDNYFRFLQDVDRECENLLQMYIDKSKISA